MEDHFSVGEPTLADSKESPIPKSKAKKRWKLLKNVIHASHLFKNSEIKVMQDIDELVQDVQSSPTRIEYSRTHTFLLNDVLDEHKVTEKLFCLIQRSNKQDLIDIETLIENHPKRFVRSFKDPDSYLNKKNVQGVRPLYEAARHGYWETIQILLDYGADCHLKSDLKKKDEENALQVAVRWGYFEVVKQFLQCCSWRREELKAALKLSNNPKISEIIRSYMPKGHFCMCR
ncbi:unnamed protein product [Blepharisma stoltei]|uniref:Ankyrin repeat domain-containing protein n=1 Tax=Blepharisma stoltei TaxID=1481888 RepID=A0AAU9I9Q1_9CILI|nr:unnamed protein product [Blepharisma stoltei]